MTTGFGLESGVPFFKSYDNYLVWSNFFYIRDSVVLPGTQAFAGPECQSAPGKNQKTDNTRRIRKPEKKGESNRGDLMYVICLFL